MFTSLLVTTPPASPVVPTGLAKQHLRIDGVTEDTLVALYAQTATELAERFLNRALITQTLTWTFKPQADNYPEGYLRGRAYPMLPGMMSYDGRMIELPRPIVQSVSSVNITDNAGTVTALTNYRLDTSLQPARINLGLDLVTTPITYPIENVQIVYVAGYGNSATAVPTAIRNAILLMTAWLYEHRGDTGDGEMPKAAESLLWPYRVTSFG